MEERLQTIYGIGPEVAKSLKARLIDLRLVRSNASTEDIRRALRNRRIFDELTVATKVDLLYNPIKDIPREIIDIMNRELHRYVHRIKFDIAGSYIRGKPVSHDVDLVVSKGQRGVVVLDDIIHTINRRSKVVHILPPFARGMDKAMTLFEIIVPPELRSHELLRGKMTTTKKIRVKVDIFLCNPSDYMYTLLFAIGSGVFNIRMRALAKRKGYLLNQHGLYKKDKLTKVPIKTERELFKVLGMAYRTPQQRNK